MYKVIAKFVDLRDNGHVYNVGDEYPHDNISVTADRIGELSTTRNKRGIRLIQEIKASVVGAEEPVAVESQNKKRKKR